MKSSVSNSVFAVLKPLCNNNNRGNLPILQRHTCNYDVIIMSKVIKPFQVKHLFSEVVCCNVKGQSVLKHAKMLIALTPHTL